MLLTHFLLCSFSLEHLATVKHTVLSQLVLFVLIGGSPLPCIGNRKYIIEFLCTSFAFLLGHYFACGWSRYSVFLYLNLKSRMCRQTFNWENLLERLWEFPYCLLENTRITLYTDGVNLIQSKIKMQNPPSHTRLSCASDSLSSVLCPPSSVADRLGNYNDPSEDCVKNARCLLKGTRVILRILNPILFISADVMVLQPKTAGVKIPWCTDQSKVCFNIKNYLS